MDHEYDVNILQNLARKLVMAKDIYDNDTFGLTDSYVNLVNSIIDLTDYIEDGILPEEY